MPVHVVVVTLTSHVAAGHKPKTRMECIASGITSKLRSRGGLRVKI
ncbi:MAG: hypothetical protein ACTSUE_08525 [Promethearchaeota archaeon]